MSNKRSQAESPGKTEISGKKVPSYRNNKQFSVWLYALIIVITVAAVAVTIFIGKRNHGETIRLATQQFNQQQLILAHSAATGIETFIADIDDDLLALSNFPVVQRMEPGILERMEVLYKGIPPQTSSRRLDKNGILRFIYPNEGWRKDLIGRDYSQETWFQKAKKTGEVVISGLIINEAGERRIRVVRPVYVEDEKRTREFNGVIKCSINPETMTNLYVSPIVSGETGYAWLLNEDGFFLSHHEGKFVGQDAFRVRSERNPELSYNAINNIQLQMMAGEEGVGRYLSGWHRAYKGEIEKLIAYTPVRVLDKIWSVAVCAPVDEVERITKKAYRNELYALGFIIFILTAAGVSFFIAFYRWSRSLQQEIEIRKQAEERIVHLNAVLRAIRKVNQLIVKVKERGDLLHGICESLIETRGYHSAWIALIEEGGKFITAAQAGAGEGFPAMIDKLKSGELMRCMQQSVEQPGIVMVANPAVECSDCPLVGTYAGNARLIARLEYGSRIYGFLTVTFPVEMAQDEEERLLFDEVSGDIAFALHSIEMEKERKQAEERIINLMESIPIGISISTSEGDIPEVNMALWKIFGYNSKEEFTKIPGSAYYYDQKDRERFLELHKGGLVKDFEVRFKRKDGTVFWGSVTSTTQTTEAGKTEFINVLEDITERKQAEKALRESEEKFRTFMETASDLMHISDKDGNLTYVNESTAKTLGYSKEEMIGMHITQVLSKETLERDFKPKWEELSKKGEIILESTWVAKDGKEIYGEIKVVAVYDSDGKYEGAKAVFHDMTEHKKAEEDRKKLEAQFQQSQKLEAIGSLAGGVAHDFNNILTVIIGNAELLSISLGKDNPLQGRVEEISKGGERAASLTRQLLAFSRRQVLQPQVLDLNGIIPNMDKMLRRLIGEDIDLETVLAPELGRVEADPGQIEQVIMNLAVNARDAMPTGGKLTIETANVDLDESYADKHVAVKPGPYVMMAISDTGTGMDEETKSYIFDPFFTTKEKGRGTGLGLSTVYGIVKQSGGNIWVYSEPEKGTTFKIYLPRVEKVAETAEKVKATAESLTGSETIMVVEDDEMVRDMARSILQRYGYSILDAQDGEEAIRVSEQYEGPIHLMLTDVVMPGMSGRVLAEQLAVQRPKMKVLYMSGYTDNAIVRHGVLDKEVIFIQKPFTVEALAQKVREVLDS